MKKLWMLPVLLVLLAGMVVGIPYTLNIQGKLTDASGSSITAVHNITASIYTNTTGTDSLVYSRNFTVIPDARGIYHLTLQNVSVNFSGPAYIGLKVDPENNESELSPRLNVSLVPFSYRANISEDLSCTDCLSQAQIQDIYVENTGDTVSGQLNITGNVVIGGLANLTDVNITGGLYVRDKVGIGEINPTHPLVVSGAINASALNISGIVFIQGSTNLTNLNVSGGLFVRDQAYFISNVGIGTTTPLATLEVKGSGNFSGGVNITGELTVGDLTNLTDVNVSGGLYVRDQSYLTGNVGIGTTTPLATLEVKGSANFSGGVNITGELTVGDLTNLTDLNVTGGLYVRDNVGIGTLTPSAALDIIGDLEVGSTDFFVDDSEGRVGIGTITPLANLEVKGSANISGGLNVTGELAVADLANLTDVNISGGLYVRDEAYLNSRVGIGNTAPSHQLEVSGGVNATALNVSGGVLLATNAGNVGIGTSIANHTLTVQGGINASQLNVSGAVYIKGLTNLSDTNITGGLYIRDSAGIGTTSPNHRLEVAGGINATDLNISGNVLLASNAGNVGIGTSIANHTLTVQGGINASQLNISGAVYIKGLTNVSDLNVTGGLYVRDQAAFNSQILIQGNSIHDILSWLNTSLNNSLRLEDTNLNTSLKDYINERDSWLNTSVNNSLRLEDTNLNTSMKAYADNADSLLNSSIRALGYFNSESNITGYLNLSNLKVTGIANFTDVNITGGAYIRDNLGIGVISPSYKLQVSGTSNLSGNVLILGDLNVTGNTALNALNVSGLTLSQGNVIAKNVTISDFLKSDAGKNLTLLADNGKDVIIMKSDSNVSGAIDVLVLTHAINNDTNGSNNIGAGVLFTAEDTTGAMENISAIRGVFSDATNNSEDGDLVFFTRSAGGGLVEVARIAADGTVNVTDLNVTGGLYVRDKVGIGTDAPTATLQINSSNTAGAFAVYNSTGTGAATYMFINGTSGNVGIGTTAPANMLEIVKQGAAPSMRLAGYTTGSSGAPIYRIARARGTEESPTAVVSAD